MVQNYMLVMVISAEKALIAKWDPFNAVIITGKQLVRLN